MAGRNARRPATMAGTQSDIQPRVDRSLDLGFLDSFVGSGSLDLDAIAGIDAEMVRVWAA